MAPLYGRHRATTPRRTRRWQDRRVTDVPASFPRRSAATRGFRLGAPRSFTIAPDGSRVVFLRSGAGDDPNNSLWVLDVSTGQERQLLAPAEDRDLTDAERARRERVREVAGGVVSYATDAAVHRAVVAQGHDLHLVDLRSGRVDVVDTGGPVHDPRLDPTGRRVAFARERGLWVHDVTGMASTAPVAVVPAEDDDAVSWGLADFVAAEEMGRTRGFWWAPHGGALLVLRVDENPVAQHWIADPANPDRPPQRHRYPAAGTANAVVTAHVLDLGGGRVDVDWDRQHYEYVVDGGWDEDGPWLAVQSRDQREVALLAVAGDGQTSVLATRAEEPWVELVPGVPRRHGERVVDVRDDASTDTRRLLVDGTPLSPPQLQVRAVVDVDDDGVLCLVTPTTDSRASWHQQAVRFDWSGNAVTVGRADGWVNARTSGGTTLVVEQGLDEPGATVRVVASDETVHRIASHAETPPVAPRPIVVDVPASAIRVAVLLPTERRDAGPLPVLVDPYGGPHGQRVLAAQAAFTTAQWWADQGFAVVVVDGRGMPGTPAWEKSVHLDFASGVLDDQVTGLMAAAAALPGVLDLSRVGIIGWSFGGFLAALAAMDRPDVFHAAVAGAPVTEWALYDTHYTERYLGRPGPHAVGERTGDDVYAASSLIDRADRLERPLLLIHGMVDDNVLVAHTLRLSSALVAAGRRHEVLPLSGVTHMTPQEVVAENLLLLQRDFLRRSLGLDG
jgi:dipeptidyl-peptidase-4